MIINILHMHIKKKNKKHQLNNHQYIYFLIILQLHTAYHNQKEKTNFDFELFIKFAFFEFLITFIPQL